MSYLLTGPEGVLPMIIRNSSRPHPPLVAVNSGAIRFDIFQGDFTINDEFIVMPFKNRFMYIPNVPRSAAAQFIDALNDGQSQCVDRLIPSIIIIFSSQTHFSLPSRASALVNHHLSLRWSSTLETLI